jgi:hypothetical protein
MLSRLALMVQAAVVIVIDESADLAFEVSG